MITLERHTMLAGSSTNTMDSSSTSPSMRTTPRYFHASCLANVLLIKYLQIYLPITYALNQFGLAFATIISLFVWIILEKRNQLAQALKSISQDLSTDKAKPDVSQRSAYNSTPTWWYWITAAISLFLAIFCCEYWKVQLPWYGVLLAFALGTVLFVPVSVM